MEGAGAILVLGALVAMGITGRASLNGADSPRLRYTGRWALRDGAMVTINTGSVLEARFKGGRCVLHFDTRGLTEKPQVYVQIDGGPPQKATVEETLEFRASGEAGAKHDLRLTVKAVEEHQRNWVHLEGAVKFTGIETDGGLLALPRDNRPLVEFVGDSITAGVLLGTEGSTTERMDGFYASPSLVGQLLNVRVSPVGFGRLGIMIEGNGEVPVARDSFGFCFQDAPVAHRPAMLVINLGTNDHSRPDDAFAVAYRDYLAVVGKSYPQAILVCLRPYIGSHADAIRTEVERAQTAGDKRIHYVDTTGWLGPGDYTDGVHPNAQGHRKAADHLAQALKPLLPARSR